MRKDLYDKFVRDGSFYGRRVQSKAKIILENTGTVQHRNNGEFHHQDEQHQHRDLRKFSYNSAISLSNDANSMQ